MARPEARGERLLPGDTELRVVHRPGGREASAAKVLVLDGVWEASTRLPSIDWLVQNGGAGAAAEEAIGAHAAKCFTQLGKPI